MEVVLIGLVVIGLGAFLVWKFLLQEDDDRVSRHEDQYADDEALEQDEEHEAEGHGQPELHQRERPSAKDRKFVNRLTKDVKKEEIQHELLFEDPQAILPFGEEKIIVLFVKSPVGMPFAGAELASVLNQEGFVHGDMGIYHLHGPARQSVLSIASAVEPGLFDVKTMSHKTFPAIAVFLRLPGPMPPLKSFDLMLQKTHNIAKAMRGSMLDGTHSTLTQQTIAHLRGQMSEYQRKVQIAAARMHA